MEENIRAIKIHELIKPETWCKHHIAEDAQGSCVSHNDPKACKWCFIGWIRRIYGSDDASRLEGKILDIIGKEDLYYLGFWNDDERTTFEMVQNVAKLANL